MNHQLLSHAGALVAEILLARRGLVVKDYNPNQPRVPRGNSDGGQWTNGGIGGLGSFAKLDKANTLDSIEEAVSYGKEHYESWQKSLTKEQAEALSAYRGSSFLSINEHLRGIKLDDSARNLERIRLIDEALGRAGLLPDDLEMYRGLPESVFGPNGIDSSLIGTVIEDGGYVSTSLSRQVAINQFGGRGQAIARILAPRGSHGAYIEFFNRMLSASEAEFLFPRGTRFLIIGVDTDRTPPIITMIALTP